MSKVNLSKNTKFKLWSATTKVLGSHNHRIGYLVRSDPFSQISSHVMD